MTLWQYILDFFTPVESDAPVTTPFTPCGGRITSYGYLTDSTPDHFSSSGIGAFTQHLSSGISLAVSRDIESMFHVRGINPRDPVEVRLASGDVLQLRWDDRTASEYAGKVLLGRFDIYDKDAPSRYVDSQVTGFRKAV